jgi:hypothetical protein
MKKKVWLLIIIGLLIVIGISGKVVVDNQKERKHDKVMAEKSEEAISQYKINEEKIVMDVLATYKEVDTIEFVNVGENELTGGTHYAFKLNGFKGFSYYFIGNEMYGDESVVIDEVKEREVELTTKELLALKDKVKIIYGGWEVMDTQGDGEVTIEQKVEAERMSVVALKNTFSDIKSIKFKYTDFNAMTGSYGMEIEMSNLEGKSVVFDYSFSEGIKEISSYKVVDENGVQKEGKTTGKVRVIYSNGNKGEI